MKQTRSPQALTSLVCALTLAIIQVAHAALPEKPNVVFILVDDMGYASLSQDYRRGEVTPNLDQLAADGVNFTQAYVTHAYCGPSRAGIMAGRYQQRFGFEANPEYNPHHLGAGFPEDQTILSEVMKSKGYATACIGKWHLGGSPIHHPLHRGFDEFYGFLHGTGYYTTRLGGPNGDFVRREHEIVDEITYMTDDFSDAAIDFIERKKDEPFFLFISYNAPHGPFRAPQSAIDSVVLEPGVDESARIHVAMINVLDEGIGRVRAKLIELGLDENTMIIFTNDNGGHSLENGMNAPLRGKKGTHYEGGLRVPFIMSWPAALSPGQTFTKPISTLDVFATSIELAGATPAELNDPIDGKNLVNYLERVDGTPADPSEPHEALFWRDGNGWQWSVLKNGFKLKGGSNATVHPTEMYNLSNDLSETTDLYNDPAFAAQRADLEAEYAAWNALNVAPLFGNNQPFGNEIDITVTVPSTETFTVNSVPATVPLEVTLENDGGRTMNYEWTVYGEGATLLTAADTLSPTLTISDPGEYRARITVRDDEYISHKEVRIFARPSALPTEGEIIRLKNISSNSFVSADPELDSSVDAYALFESVREKWRVRLDSSGFYALQSIRTGGFLTASPDGSLAADAFVPIASLTDASKFSFTSNAAGDLLISLKSTPTTYLRTHPEGNLFSLLADGSLSDAETAFDWQTATGVLPELGDRIWIRSKAYASYLSADRDETKFVTTGAEPRLGSTIALDDSALWTVQSIDGNFIGLINEETGLSVTINTLNGPGEPGSLVANQAGSPQTSENSQFSLADVNNGFFSINPKPVSSGLVAASSSGSLLPVTLDGTVGSQLAEFSWGKALRSLPVVLPGPDSPTFPNGSFFPVLPVIGDVIWIRSEANNQFLSTTTGGNAAVAASASEVSDFELWRIVDSSEPPFIALQSVGRQALDPAVPDMASFNNTTASELRVTQTYTAGAPVPNWTKLNLFSNSDGTISFDSKALAFSHLRADDTNGGIVTGTGTLDDLDTKFIWGYGSDDPPLTYAQWAAQQGLSGADAGEGAQPYGDGIDNLLKYASNLTGNEPHVQLLEPNTGTGGLPNVQIAGADSLYSLRFEYLRRRNAGLTYTPVMSTDLTDWSEIDAGERVINIDSNWDRVTLEFPVDGNAVEKAFGRIEVTSP